DGLPVEIVAALPADALVCVNVASADVAAHDAWFADALGAARVGPATYALGSTLIVVAAAPNHPPTGALVGRGFRYLTVQVADVVGGSVTSTRRTPSSSTCHATAVSP